MEVNKAFLIYPSTDIQAFSLDAGRGIKVRNLIYDISGEIETEGEKFLVNLVKELV